MGRLDVLPGEAVVVGAEQAAVGAGVDPMPVVGVNGQGADVALGGQSGLRMRFPALAAWSGLTDSPPPTVPTLMV